MNAATVPKPTERADPALARRAVSGVVLVAAAILDLWVGGWLFTLSVAGVVLLMADEWGRLATETPRLIESAAWGSRSTRSTRWPSLYRATPRLMVVVVFPTPPFWLAIAMMRGI